MTDYSLIEIPQNVEAEANVLGGMLIDIKILDDIMPKLSSNLFYSSKHKIIYKAIKALYNNNKLHPNQLKRIDLVSINELLSKEKMLQKAGGAIYVAGLTETVSTSANILSHIDILKDKLKRRIAIEGSNSVLSASYNGGDIDIPIDNLNRSMDVLGGLNETLQYDLGDHLKTALTSIEHDMDADESTYRILTGFRQLDNNLVLRKENLVIIGARPAVGKSAFSANLAYGISQTNKIGIVSLEMSGEEIMERFIAMESEIDGFHIARRKLTDEQYEKIIQSTQKLCSNDNLKIDDDFQSSLEHVVARCKRLKRKFKVECIIIDYLQLITTKGYNKNDEIGKISRTLKMLAKELRIPIIVLSQLSRGIESRENECPRLSDLRDSGSLEQDANTVIFLWQKNPTVKEIGGAEYPNKVIDITIAKQRQGRLATINMVFEKKYQKFKDIGM